MRSSWTGNVGSTINDCNYTRDLVLSDLAAIVSQGIFTNRPNAEHCMKEVTPALLSHADRDKLASCSRMRPTP